MPCDDTSPLVTRQERLHGMAQRGMLELNVWRIKNVACWVGACATELSWGLGGKMVGLLHSGMESESEEITE